MCAQPGDQVESSSPWLPASPQISEATDHYSDLFDLTSLPVTSATPVGMHTPIAFQGFDCSENTNPNIARHSLFMPNKAVGKSSPMISMQSNLPLTLPDPSSKHQQAVSSQVLAEARTPRARGVWATPQRAALTQQPRATEPAVATDRPLGPATSSAPSSTDYDSADAQV